MIYLSGALPKEPHLKQMLKDAGIGFMATPTPHGQYKLGEPGWVAAADNGCFSSNWKENKWKQWLDKWPSTPLFTVVPDVVGDALQTRLLWDIHSGYVKAIGHKATYVLQDGETGNLIPWDELDCIFIGGTTEYKLSDTARRITGEAKDRNKHVHMGRVNSTKRMRLAFMWGVDSVDGTFIKFGPDVNTPKLIDMLFKSTQPVLC